MISATPDKPRWVWWLLKLGRKIWFRTVFFALLSVVGALIAAPVAPLIPTELAARISPDAVSDILRILSSSMLIVATFSLSTTISAYSAASSETTPRVTDLLMQDPTAQNTLSTFVGGFLFSLVGFIGLGAGIYGENGHVVLFALTLVMVLIIVMTFLRWVDVLSRFGRVRDAIDRTESAATDSISGRTERPHLGGCPVDDSLADGFEVIGEKVGYVRYIDMPTLQESAERFDGSILVTAPPGAFVVADQPVACTTFEPDDETRKSITAAFDIAPDRTFDQDPEHGVSALAEIGIRALSPSVNDPVTAIRVIDRLVGVLTIWGNASVSEEPRYDRVQVPALDSDRLFDIAFSQLALYGAADVRVGERLQEALRALSRIEDAESARAARRQATKALAHAKHGLRLEEDYQRLRAINESFTSG